MRHLGRWLLWTFALLAAAFILLQGWYAAHIWWWREHAPRETAFMAMRLAELQERRPDARLAYRWVGYDGISVALKRAVIAAEDAKFVEHEGFDWLDKRRILELYLNVIEWGDGIFGAEAASRRYFGMSSAALTAEHAARLAAMAPNPRYYEKHPDARGLARKTTIILARMPAAELP